jgi:DNA-binding transcriptional ArsR family regulator
VSDRVSEPTETSDKTTPTSFRVIDDAEALKAIGDPLRMRMLQLMMVAISRTWSVKEVAAELGQPVTKLYHHIKLLESAELIKDVESRIVSGIVEHRYRASQRSLRFDESLFTSDETRHDSIAQMSALLESVRDDLLDYLYREDVDYDLVSLSRMTTRLTSEEIAEVNTMIDDMIAKFQANRDATDRSSLPRTQIVFMMSPLAHDPGE